jgi:hypothetical protein
MSQTIPDSATTGLAGRMVHLWAKEIKHHDFTALS